MSTAYSKTLARLVIEGDFSQLRRLVTEPDPSFWNVLMLVADTVESPIESEKCILYLFELGADSKASDRTSDTVAHLAARRDHVRMLALLPFDAKWLRNEKGATPLMEAARSGSWKCAKHLMHQLRQSRFNECEKQGNSKRVELLGQRDLLDRTAFDLAKLNGHPELAGEIEREMRMVVNEHGRILGLTAQEDADRRQLQRLVEAGDSAGLRRAASSAICDLPDEQGMTALMWAAGKRHFDDEALWEQLVQLADPTCADALGHSCLHYAIKSGNCLSAIALLDAGASVNSKNQFESTPLMWAAFLAPPADAAAVSRVLLDAGADWSIKDKWGRTALDWAAQKGQSELAGCHWYKGTEFFDVPQDRLTREPPFIKRWDNLRLITRGDFAEIHEALTDKGVKCAVKTVKLLVQIPDRLNSVKNETTDKDIENEIDRLTSLQHKSIVRFLHISQPEPATVVLFMELLDGCSLEKLINNKPLDELTVRDYCNQICGALLYLHSLQPPVIHGNVNCSNIVVLFDKRQLKMIGFGVSTNLEQSLGHMPANGQSPQSAPNFMAPELLEPAESKSVQHIRESDIWAFGCTVFQMASGSVPFHNARNFCDVAKLIVTRGAPELPDSSSEELRDFYSRCTDKTPSLRQSAVELFGHKFLNFIPPYRERWNLVRLLDKGGFGDVHEVLTDRGIRCAAKTIQLPVKPSDQLGLSIRWMNRVARLVHGNIVRFLHIAQPEPLTIVLFMELLDGCSLERFIDQNPQDEMTVRDFSKQICSALVYIHSRRPPFIHKDISCSNIVVLAGSKQLRIIGFGLSIMLQQPVDQMWTSAQTTRGTWNFMAPELLESGKSAFVQYTRESDIWAFGCIVFQMFTGQRPFTEYREQSALAKALKKSGASALPRNCSAELKDFYNCCSAKNPRSRKSAAELMDHLFLTGGKIKKTRVFGIFGSCK